jgi:hypothetical protein
MKKIAQIISVLALLGTLAPALLFFNGTMDLASVKTWMLIATVVWFVSATLWMEHKVAD